MSSLVPAAPRQSPLAGRSASSFDVVDGPCSGRGADWCRDMIWAPISRGTTLVGGIVTAGLDLAKNVFQIHRIDGEGWIGSRRKSRRAGVLRFFSALSPCLVGLEACASSHYWAREIAASAG
jgi:hypothetical protein